MSAENYLLTHRAVVVVVHSYQKKLRLAMLHAVGEKKFHHLPENTWFCKVTLRRKERIIREDNRNCINMIQSETRRNEKRSDFQRRIQDSEGSRYEY